MRAGEASTLTSQREGWAVEPTEVPPLGRREGALGQCAQCEINPVLSGENGKSERRDGCDQNKNGKAIAVLSKPFSMNI